MTILEKVKLFFARYVWVKWLLVALATFLIGILALNGIFGLWNYVTARNELNLIRKERDAAIKRADASAESAAALEKQIQALETQKVEEQKKYEEIKRKTSELEADILEIQRGNRRPVGTLDERVDDLQRTIDALTNAGNGNGR